MNADWLTPEWPAPPWVGAVCTSRAGGVSKPPYERLNLGDHVGDQAGDVLANRSNLGRQIGAKPVFLNQVHQYDVVHLNTGTPHGTVADACVTRQTGLACTIMVADCLPVLWADRSGTVVAAAHAGWRGLAGVATGAGPVGVLETCFFKFITQALGEGEQNNRAAIARDTLVWLGPCIGVAAFEVGDEVRQAFVGPNPATEVFFAAKGQGKWLADLQGLARQRLTALGVTQVFGNDGSPGWCTVANPSRFFSHRRDAARLGGSGRMAASIWLG